MTANKEAKSMEDIAQSAALRETVIRPAKGFAQIDLRELWSYRALLASLTRRRLKSEFDQQYLAYVWAVARPLLMILLFSYFRHISSAKTGVDIPYPLYLYSGLILWFFFVETVNDTSTSVKANAALIQKVYFPRILTPLAAILSNLVMLSIAAVPLVLLMAGFGVWPGWNLLLLPLVLLQVALLIMGVGCIFAALGVGTADWDRFLSFALYIGLFVSPIIYSPAMLPEKAQLIYSLNPMSGTLLAFRSALFDGFPWPVGEWYYSLGFSVLIATVGVVVFQRAERNMSDRL
jgi:lipopolysaccharide transport system permease protein